MANYLTERRKELELTMRQVAEAVGVSEGTVSRWESGAIANMKRDKIYALAHVLKTTPSFIMTGEGGEALPANLKPLPKTKKIPLLGTIACGEPILAVENVADYIDADAETHADFALCCKGDSMINARIFDGDIVYIRKQEAVENGEIAAVLVDGTESEAEATLKRFYHEGDKIRLAAENPMYPDQLFAGERINSVRVIGKAVAFLSTVR
ncbi:MAG: LexA family transcriptional regulator [Bacillota bacterium]|nr:LexA family transcriptional regulator [Bacillota bacterium]